MKLSSRTAFPRALAAFAAVAASATTWTSGKGLHVATHAAVSVSRSSDTFLPTKPNLTNNSPNAAEGMRRVSLHFI
jgi:hypothetical protein